MVHPTIWRQRLSNYGCGALALLATVALRGVGISAYRTAYDGGLQLLPGVTVFGFVASFVAIDLLYYWQHRLEHRVGALWAIHSVHHQSELCDASVSLRIPVLASLAVGLFHLPLAVLGVNPWLYVLAYGAHAAIVFLFHSRTPAWLDRAGWVFNSPYLHRLHHASNPELVDRNFAGVLVIWDRLWGTFQPRHRAPLVFGVDGAPTPLSPVEANLAPWRRLLRPSQTRAQ